MVLARVARLLLYALNLHVVGTAQQILLGVKDCLTQGALDRCPLAGGCKLACLNVVAQLSCDVLLHNGAAGWIEHGVGNLHAVLSVARHHVGRGQINHVGLNAKRIDARVLQESAHDGANMHVVRLARDTR